MYLQDHAHSWLRKIPLFTLNANTRSQIKFEFIRIYNKRNNHLRTDKEEYHLGQNIKDLIKLNLL